jgi:hypothetical protein
VVNCDFPAPPIDFGRFRAVPQPRALRVDGTPIAWANAPPIGFAGRIRYLGRFDEEERAAAKRKGEKLQHARADPIACHKHRPHFVF